MESEIKEHGVKFVEKRLIDDLNKRLNGIEENVRNSHNQLNLKLNACNQQVDGFECDIFACLKDKQQRDTSFQIFEERQCNLESQNSELKEIFIKKIEEVKQ